MFVSFLLPYHPYRFQRLYSHTAYSGILNPSHIHAPSLHPQRQPHPGYIPTPSHIQGTSLPPATSRVHPYPYPQPHPGYIPTPNASHIHGSSLLLPPATSRVYPCPKQQPRSTPTPAISTPIPAISTPTPATSRVHPYLPPATSRAHPSIPTSRSLYPGPHLPSHCSRHVCFTACPVPVVTLCGVVDVYRDCVVFLTASEERSDPSA